MAPSFRNRMALLRRFRNHPLYDFAALLRRFMLPRWRRFVFALVVGILAGFLTSLHPLVFAPALNLFTSSMAEPAGAPGDITLNNLGPTILQFLHLDPSSELQIILVVVLAYILLALVIALFNFTASIQNLVLRMEIVADMIRAMHEHVLGLSMQYFNRRASGDFVSRITADARETANGLDMLVGRMLRFGAHVLTSMFFLLRTDALLTLGVLALASVHFGFTRLLAGRVRGHSLRSATLLGRLSHVLFESVTGIRVIKTMAGERFASRTLRTAIASWRESTMKLRKLSLVEQPLRFALDAVLVGCALVLTYLAMHHGRLTIEAAALFFILTRQMIDPVSQLAQTVLKINAAVGGASRIQELFNTEAGVQDGPEEAGPLREGIRFDGVTFAYEPDQPVLSGINLDVARGQKVAVVGPSGAGKTTLADLLMRHYDPAAGRVLYDGKDIRAFRQRGYRRQFGVVSQECLLFSGSVRENIEYGRNSDAEAFDYAIDVANAREFIEVLPEGADTLVGDRGVRLSGGQRQRIALARAIYGRPSLLVLDEATSALDAESERAVQQGIDQAIRGCTAVIIAHRFSTVANADAVVVLNQGRLEAVGRHADLIDTSPTYRKLYELQFQPRAGEVT